MLIYFFGPCFILDAYFFPHNFLVFFEFCIWDYILDTGIIVLHIGNIVSIKLNKLFSEGYSKSCILVLESEKEKVSIRLKVHFLFSVIIFIVIQIFNLINDESVVNAIFKAAGYTYGPLLGLFAFGIFTKYKIRDKYSLTLASSWIGRLVNCPLLSNDKKNFIANGIIK